MGKPVVITLTVQADTLFGLTNPTQSQIDNLCSFTDDNNGNSPNNTLEDFTTSVYINNNVRWVGISNAQGYTISIDSISIKNNGGGYAFFNSTTLYGSGGISGNVNANVKNDNSLLDKMNDYLISFTVYESPSNSKSHSIDPKLQINQ